MRCSNLFTYNGPCHDINVEIQKSTQLSANEIDELDNEVAMISQKSPKEMSAKAEEEVKVIDKDESNTRNFNSIPRNYNDNSEKTKSEIDTEEVKKSKVDSKDAQSQVTSPEEKGAPLTSISIFGAKGIQSKINLIPLFNIKYLFHRSNRFEEVLNIEYMCAISLM